jgi:aminopeptidase
VGRLPVPDDAFAQEAGMSTSAFEDFFYGACLRDWGCEGDRMRRSRDRFDAADEVRIVGDGHDLTLSPRGPAGRGRRRPREHAGGEFFFSPVEDSAEGTILFDVPTELDGAPVSGSA